MLPEIFFNGYCITGINKIMAMQNYVDNLRHLDNSLAAGFSYR